MEKVIPSAFIWRRLHSLTGVWLSIYLAIHLFTNSQAALWFGDDGSGFIHAVNSIHELPYLFLIELAILGVPILIHLVWGIHYLRTANYNTSSSDGTTPSLPEYSRNRAYTWQRLTSYALIIGIAAHIIHMRVIEYPLSAQVGFSHSYIVRVTNDEGIPTLASRLSATVYDQQKLNLMKGHLAEARSHLSIESMTSEDRMIEQQSGKWFALLEKKPLRDNEVIIEANNFGTVELFMLRDTFKMPLMLVLYTLFVLTACYHGFNGLWTAMITWGVTLNPRSQRYMRLISHGLMVIVAALGLAAVWLTYWVNLKY